MTNLSKLSLPIYSTRGQLGIPKGFVFVFVFVFLFCFVFVFYLKKVIITKIFFFIPKGHYSEFRDTNLRKNDPSG